MNEIVTHSFLAEIDEIIKTAARAGAPITKAWQYEEKRRAAQKDRQISQRKREELMRSYLESRGKDKGRTTRATVAGGAAGGTGGAVAGGAVGGVRGAIGGAILGALVGGAGWRGISKARRRRAAEAAKDPEQVRAYLRKTRKKRRVKQEYKLTSRGMAARKGQKPSKGGFRFTAGPRSE